MKVCILSEFFFPSIHGGAEIDLHHFMKDLTNRGIEVYMLTPNYNNYKEIITKKGNLTIHKFKSLRYFLFKNKVRQISQRAYLKSTALFYLLNNQYMKHSSKELAKQFDKVHKKERFDLVHTINIESNCALRYIKDTVRNIATAQDMKNVCLSNKTIGYDYCKECSVKNIKRCLKTNIVLAALLKSNLINYRRNCLKYADKILTPTLFYKEETEKVVQQNNTYLVPNIIRGDIISNLTKEEARKKLNMDYDKIILFVGSFIHAKGTEYITWLAEQLPDYHFIMVGKGPLKFEETSNLHILDFVDQKELIHYYKAADLLINPTIDYSGFGRTIIEAQLNKLPVVAFSTKYIDEAIRHNKTGWLVPLKDKEKLKQEIKFLMDSEAVRVYIAVQAERIAKEKYDAKEIINKIIKIYNGRHI